MFEKLEKIVLIILFFIALYILFDRKAILTSINLGFLEFSIPEKKQTIVTTLPDENFQKYSPYVDINTGSQENDNTVKCDGFDWLTCWIINDNERTLTWIGTQDGSGDIGQSGIVKEKIVSGYTAIVNITQKMIIEICSGTIDGVKPEGNCPKKVEISEGTHYVVSPGESGGFCIHR